MKLLEQTILELQAASRARELPRAALNLGIELRIPPGYVPEAHQRMAALQARQPGAHDGRARVAARGAARPLRPAAGEVLGLVGYAELRVKAEALGIVQVDAAAGALTLRFDPRTTLRPEPLAELAGARGGARLLPDGLRWPTAGEPPQAALEALLGRLASVA